MRHKLIKIVSLIPKLGEKMSIMKTFLQELTTAVSRQSFQDEVTVQQIMLMEDYKRLIENCRKLRVSEEDILVAVVVGKRKSDAKRRKAA